MKLQRLGIEIVSGCQLKCVGCPNSTLNRKIRQVDPEDLALYLKNIDVTHVEFLKLYQFGEIFLHDNLPKIFEVIESQDFKIKHVEISTNGQILDEDKILTVFESGIVTRFGVSADGDGTPAEYEKLRPGADWDTLEQFMDLVKDASIFSPWTKLFLKVIPTGKPKWEPLAKKYGFKIEYLKWRKAPDSVKFENADLKIPNGPCKHVKSTRIRCYVDVDGTVVPCCCHPRAHAFGSLKRNKFSEIYNGKLRREYLSMMKTLRPFHSVCGRCEVK